MRERALLGAVERIVHEVDHRVGERLEIRRRGRDLEAAELRPHLARAARPAARSRPRRSRRRSRTPRSSPASTPAARGSRRRSRCRRRRRPGTARCPPCRRPRGTAPRRDRSAGTVTSRPAPSVSVAFAARAASRTVIGASVWFCTTTGSSNVSPKFRNRGGRGRTISGSRAVIALSPLPNCLSPATATAIDAIARQVVGHLDRHGRLAVRVGLHRRRERGERVEVRANRDRRRRLRIRPVSTRAPSDACVESRIGDRILAPVHAPIRASSAVAFAAGFSHLHLASIGAAAAGIGMSTDFAGSCPRRRRAVPAADPVAAPIVP